MSFGFGVGDIMAISQLATKVYTGYKDAPNDYKNVAEEVKSLQIIINNAAHHFKGTYLTENCRKDGQEVLKGCRSVLEDLNSLIEKYKSLASANTSQAFQRIKFGTEDIPNLRARITSNATFLSSFIRRYFCYYYLLYYAKISLSCEYLEMQSQLNNLLSLHRTGSNVSIDTISTFAGSTKTKGAFKTLCQNLYQIGVRADTIKEKEKEILNIFKPQSATTSGQVDDSDIANQSNLQDIASSGQVDDSDIANQSQLLAVSDFLGVAFVDRNILIENS